MFTKTQVEQYGTAFAKELGQYFSDKYKNGYELATIRFDWSPRRRCSRGGMYKAGPGINIAMSPIFLSETVAVSRFYEYASYDSDKQIGGFLYTNPSLHLKAVIAHEVAHSLQFFEYSMGKSRCKPHGPRFKAYYLALRGNFINRLLENQSKLAEYRNAELKALKVQNA